MVNHNRSAVSFRQGMIANAGLSIHQRHSYTFIQDAVSEPDERVAQIPNQSSILRPSNKTFISYAGNEVEFLRQQIAQTQRGSDCVRVRVVVRQDENPRYVAESRPEFFNTIMRHPKINWSFV